MICLALYIKYFLKNSLYKYAAAIPPKVGPKIYIQRYLHSDTLPVTISLTKLWANPMAGFKQPPDKLPAKLLQANKAIETINVEIVLSFVNFALGSPIFNVIHTLT